jgi:hypothetical protein
MQGCSGPLHDDPMLGIMTTEQPSHAGGTSDNFGIKASLFPKATEDETPFEEQVTMTDDSSTTESIFMAANTYTAKSTRFLRDILPMSAHHEIMTGANACTATPWGIMDALKQACTAVSNVAILKEQWASPGAPELFDDMSSIDGDDDLLSYPDVFPSSFDPVTFFDEE